MGDNPLSLPILLRVDRGGGEAAFSFLSERYTCLEAAGGREALELLRDHPVEAAVIGQDLQDMPGLELVETVRNLYPHLTIIFAAEGASFRLAAEAVDRGADALLEKPFPPADLLRKLERRSRRVMTRTDLSGPVRDRILAVLQLIDADLGRGSRSEDLVQMTCLSRSSFHRHFRSVAGQPYHRYLEKVRLKRSRAMLARTDEPVQQIAGAVGLPDAGYFSRWFRLRTGESPSEFRRRARGRRRSIPLGLLLPMTGAYASLGQDLLQGARFAAEEAGRGFAEPVELDTIDTATHPGTACRNLLEAVRSRGVRCFAGCVSSAVAVAVQELIDQSDALLVTSVAVDPCPAGHRGHVFRWSPSPQAAVRSTILSMLEQDRGLNRWYTLTSDYLFGHTLLRSAVQTFRDLGIEHAGNIFHPLGAVDFRAALKKARSSGARVLVLINFGDDTLNAVRQAARMGMEEEMRILVLWSNGAQDIRRLGPGASQNVYLGCQYWPEADLPANRAFLKAWRERYEREPSYLEATGYTGVRMILMGVERTGGLDVAANIRVLETLEWSGLTARRESIEPDTHNTHKGYFLIRAAARRSAVPGLDPQAVLVSCQSH